MLADAFPPFLLYSFLILVVSRCTSLLPLVVPREFQDVVLSMYSAGYPSRNLLSNHNWLLNVEQRGTSLSRLRFAPVVRSAQGENAPHLESSSFRVITFEYSQNPAWGKGENYLLISLLILAWSHHHQHPFDILTPAPGAKR